MWKWRETIFAPGVHNVATNWYNDGVMVSNVTESGVLAQIARGNVSRTRYDAAGRRIARSHSGTAFAQPDMFNYAYNAKSELTNAVAVADAAYTYAYDFDEIGNRRTSSECGVRSAEYASNELNQYTAISTDTSALFVSPRETFTSLFDDDGNQTLVKTATCGAKVSAFPGVIKGFGDVFGHTMELVRDLLFDDSTSFSDDFGTFWVWIVDSGTDFVADGRGIGCNWSGENCECCCEKKYNRYAD